MKHTFYGLSLALLLSANCVQADNYKITGTWRDGEGKTVYMYQMKEDGKTVIVDSAVVKNDRFEMAGTFEQIDKRIITIDNDKESILLDGQPIHLDIIKLQTPTRGAEYDVKITGSREQAVFKQWKKEASAFFNMVRMLDRLDESEMNDMVKAMKNTYAQKAQGFTDTCKNSVAFACIINEFAQTYEEAQPLYDGLTQEVKDSYPGKVLAKRMEELHVTAIGQPAPEIELTAPDGSTVKLSSLRGKYVLLDFWASWCGPCLKEVPNVKAVYEEYKDKGFEIYGVSLDKDKAAWEKAIQQHGLDWIHVSSLKAWRCPAAQAYNVTGIPCMFLLDKEGRIIGKNLRGPVLRNKVASLFE